MMKGRKKQREHIHSKRRALERYGAKFKQSEIVSLIQTGKALCVGRASKYRTWWLVDIGGHPARVLYNKRTKAIITVTRVGT